ncbi:hypothetical protein [Saccharothrix sp. ALI-22-I]|uniref:hypothetical protein n=1 Tax=Saccharothrix sp. ALI-22-I TaxID=1933778 RepID=UPI0015C331FF|nr:hypothetical protein [Saccharothrix sp. ALI-22-I]
MLCIGPVVALMIAGALILWATGEEDARERVAHAFAAVCLVLGVSVPIVIFVNSASDRP